MKNYEHFILWCFNQHDEVCNQKYSNSLPYSKHLEFVLNQYEKFKHLIKEEDRWIVQPACAGHDLIEGARITYNDIIQRLGSNEPAIKIADIIYCCTEEKGKNREERHSERYYAELSENKLAIFVKLCDIIANIKYSLLTNSTMFDKYKKESKKLDFLYLGEYDEMFSYIDKLLKIN